MSPDDIGKLFIFMMIVTLIIAVPTLYYDKTVRRRWKRIFRFFTKR